MSLLSAEFVTFSRFQTFVDTSDRDGCHLWAGGRSSNGYGMFWVDGKHIQATRWLLGHVRGSSLASHEWALHTCDNPPCVRLAHLYVGTAKQNHEDCCARGRWKTPVLAQRMAAKTECVHGHVFTVENTYIDPDGGRRCRICRAARSKRYKERQRQRHQ